MLISKDLALKLPEILIKIKYFGKKGGKRIFAARFSDRGQIC